MTTLNDYVAPASDCNRMKDALRRIIEFDQRECRTAVEIDSSGNTYAVELIDGPCAAIAREALNQQLKEER